MIDVRNARHANVSSDEQVYIFATIENSGPDLGIARTTKFCALAIHVRTEHRR